MGTFILLIPVKNNVRKEDLRRIEGQINESINDFRHFMTEIGTEDYRIVPITDFMYLCNEQEIDMEDYFMSYVYVNTIKTIILGDITFLEDENNTAIINSINLICSFKSTQDAEIFGEKCLEDRVCNSYLTSDAPHKIIYEGVLYNEINSFLIKMNIV